jgi:hypothetical protein
VFDDQKSTPNVVGEVLIHLQCYTSEKCIKLITAYNPNLKGQIMVLQTEKVERITIHMFSIDDQMTWLFNKNVPTPWIIKLGLEARRIQYSKTGLDE